MKKFILTFALIFSCFCFNYSYAKYSKIEIDLTNHNLKDILALNLDMESAKIDSRSATFIVSSEELSKIKLLGYNPKIIQDDLEAYYAARLNSEKIVDYTLSDNGFSLGTMGGNFTLEETNQFFANLEAKYPTLLRHDTIGYSYENRPIICYFMGKIIPDLEQPEVLFTAVHHAREPQGLMTLCYFVNHILESANSGDVLSLNLLNSTSTAIIPIVNPDGYAYNQRTSPKGGGMWRKNMRSDAGLYGVDLNRNYGPYDYWSHGGSSSVKGDETYRGSAPFSEPETAAIRDLMLRHKFKFAVNYHAYGGLLVYPWGVFEKETVDSSLFRNIALDMHLKNKYIFGNDQVTVGYSTSGSSDDWMYMSDDTAYFAPKVKTLAFTPEVGNNLDGFWPKTSRILPVCREMLSFNYHILQGTIYDIRPMEIVPESDNKSPYTYRLTLANTGTETAPKTVWLKIRSLSENAYVPDSVQCTGGNTPGSSTHLYFDIKPKNILNNGDLVKIEVSVDKFNTTERDTFMVPAWYPSIETLYNGEDNLDNFDTEYWGTELRSDTNLYCLSDSPDGVPGIYVDLDLTTKNEVDLTNCSNAYLFFNARWDIEAYIDFSTVQASSDGGKTWENLWSDRMKYGIGEANTRQPATLCGFDGCMPSPIDQYCSLHDFIGKKILIKFSTLTDYSVSRDGMQINKIAIHRFSGDSSVETDKGNFFNAKLKSPVSSEEPIIMNFDDIFSGKVRLWDNTGRNVIDKYYENCYQIVLPKQCAGAYFLELITDREKQTVKIMVY